MHPRYVISYSLSINCVSRSTPEAAQQYPRCSLPQALTVNVQTVLLSKSDLGFANHTITLTNMLDDRFNATGPLTLEVLQVTYEGMEYDSLDPPADHIYV